MEQPKLQLHNAYGLLGLPDGATLEEVKHAYRRLALRCHPDRPGGSEGAFARIESAYQQLCAAAGATPPREGPVEQLTLTDIQRLGRQLRESPSESVRLFACKSLANAGRRSAYAYIREALYDDSPRVVLAAVEAVGSLGIRHAYGELGALYSRGSVEVRVAVLSAIEKSSAFEQFRSVVLQALDDPDGEVRRRGISCFARMRGTVSG
ncbi:MAG: HEAT repeat domain-containing protein [Alkalispirochaetaceae bacterium]